MTSLVELGHTARGEGKVGRRGGRLERRREREAIEGSVRRSAWERMCRGKAAREEGRKSMGRGMQWVRMGTRSYGQVCFAGPACGLLVAVLCLLPHIWHHQ